MALNHRDLWDTRHVKSELATRAVSEAKVFLYFLAITTFDWLQFARGAAGTRDPIVWSLSDAWAMRSCSCASANT